MLSGESAASRGGHQVQKPETLEETTTLLLRARYVIPNAPPSCLILGDIYLCFPQLNFAPENTCSCINSSECFFFAFTHSAFSMTMLLHLWRMKWALCWLVTEEIKVFCVLFLACVFANDTGMHLPTPPKKMPRTMLPPHITFYSQFLRVLSHVLNTAFCIRMVQSNFIK